MTTSTPKLISAIALVGTSLFIHQSSAVTWTGGGANNLWNNIDNWDSGIPTSATDVAIDGTFTVNVDGASFADRIQLGGSGTAVVDLNINNSLSFGDAFGQSKWGAATGDNVSVILNSGGVIDGGGDGANTASRISGNGTITLNAGSLVTHIYRQDDDGFGAGIDYIFNGGTFKMFASSAAGQIGAYRLNDGSFSGTSGTLSFFVNGDGSDLSLQSAAGTTVDLDQITIELDVIDGYTPMVGDSYDLFSLSSSGINNDIGDGTNISTFSSDGLWEFSYDLSQWNPGSAPGKGQITLTSVTSVPEPSTYAIILGLATLGFCWHRRS